MDQDRQYKYVLRRVKESPDYLKQCRELAKNYDRFGEVIMAIKNNLAGYAHDNPNCNNGYYWYDTAAMFGMPSFNYIYTYDDKTVTICSIFLNED